MSAIIQPVRHPSVPHAPGEALAEHSPTPAPTPVTTSKGSPNETDRADLFTVREGIEYAGQHLLLDFYGASQLDDLIYTEQALRDAVVAGSATLLHIHLHHFTPNDGVSGVAVLAESHISVHTWPEREFAAFDIFMCGDSRPDLAAEALIAAFAPQRVERQAHRRGEWPAERAA